MTSRSVNLLIFLLLPFSGHLISFLLPFSVNVQIYPLDQWNIKLLGPLICVWFSQCSVFGLLKLFRFVNVKLCIASLVFGTNYRFSGLRCTSSIVFISLIAQGGRNQSCVPTFGNKEVSASSLNSEHSHSNDVASKWVPLISMVLFTLSDAKHQRKKSPRTQTQSLIVNGPLNCWLLLCAHLDSIILRRYRMLLEQ